MKRWGLISVVLFMAAGVYAGDLIPLDRTPLYRRSFTARYALTGAEPVREAAFSPDSTRVGFVRNNDLFVREISTGREIRITNDGSRNVIINGAADWVYEEEYAFTRAWEFSPDSRRIAYLRFDERGVPEFSMMRYEGNLYPEPYTFKYPKAGESNSVVTLHIYDLETGKTQQVDTGPETDQYIPRIGWTPAATGKSAGGELFADSKLFFYRVNRLQNLFEVVLVGNDGDTRVIYSESSPRYIERPDDKTVTFLEDGDHFVVRSETRTGWWQSYLYSTEDGLIRALGDEERLNVDLQQWNALSKDGREFFSFTNPDGVELYGWMIKPPNFDENKKYPLFMAQYSGPGSKSVFVETLGSGDRQIYDPLLRAGYVVASVDPRGTGGRGEEFKKCTYGQLGKLETEDQIAAARHLATLPNIDPDRIGIYGWSYGGFIALNAILKGADVFALAVAVAPVTSWRFYDTIYTEAYNGLPEDNPAGYDDNSPINYAHLLRGKLLIVHGTGDDNVHVQNSFEMAKALTRAQKPFDMMIYPDDNHSMRPLGGDHVRKKIVDYVLENL